MSRGPIVSVVMSVYNSERFIEQTVRSMLGQTLKEFELIVFDDGSTDNTGRILRRLAAADRRIRLEERPHVPYVPLLNEGIEMARGEYIARMDGDDICMPRRFEKQVEHLRKHPECVLLGGRILLVDPCGSPLYYTENLLEHEEIDRKLLSGNGIVICQPACMMRRDAVMAVGGYRPHFRTIEDLDIFLRLAECGKLANVPELVLHYRQHPHSITRTKFELQMELTRQTVREAHQRRGLPLSPDWEPPDLRKPPPAEQLRHWAGIAMKINNASAARRNAMDACRADPFSLIAWRTLFSALRVNPK